MLLDSRKFSVDDIANVSSSFGSQRSSVDFIGDEHGEKKWNRGVSTYFDGDGWYWSDENPYTNKRAFKSIASLADVLRSQQKLWFSPLNGGYNKSAHVGSEVKGIIMARTKSTVTRLRLCAHSKMAL